MYIIITIKCYGILNLDPSTRLVTDYSNFPRLLQVPKSMEESKERASTILYKLTLHKLIIANHHLVHSLDPICASVINTFTH